MVDQQADHEISINGTVFPVTGRVRLVNLAVTPNPVVFGDTIHQSGTEVMSQFVQSSATGGSGSFRANARTDIDRVWTSRLETRYNFQRSLPPLSWDIGKPPSLTSEDCLLLADFNNAVIAVWAGGKVHRWNDAAALYTGGVGSGGWAAPLATITASALYDSTVYQNFLFFACGIALHQMSVGDSFQLVNAAPAQYLEVWDDKLWRLWISGGQWMLASTLSTVTDSPSWATWVVKTTTFPYGVIPTQLTTFRDVNGLTALLAVTNVGLWLYDASNDKWRQTEIRIPQLPFGQQSRSCIYRDGKLYFTSGNLGMVGIQAGNPFVATPVGLDLEDGVPSEESGKIANVVADFNWVLAIVDSTGVLGTDTMGSGLGMPFDTPEWDTISGLTTVRAWNGSWHTIWQSPVVGSASFAILASGAYSKRRAYWGAGGKVYWQALATAVHNPRHNPTPEFSAGPWEETTPWLDLGAPGTDKLLGHVEIYTSQCTVTETITVQYQIANESNPINTASPWTDLDDASGSNVITTNGLHTFRVGGKNGLKCRFARFKWAMRRDVADATNTPILEYWLVEFMRLLPATYGYVVNVALNKSMGGKTPAQLLALLKEYADASRTPNMIPFAYQDDLEGTMQTHYGRISRLQGDEEIGTDLRGISSYQVSFVVPYLQDSD